MWTEEHRWIYRREGAGYPSDLRDAEWARLEPMIPPARSGGRPRNTDMRAAMNAILYLLCTYRSGICKTLSGLTKPSHNIAVAPTGASSMT